MQLKIFIILLGSVFVTYNLVNGQELWTIQKCIQYAHENNLQLKNTALDIKSNEENLKEDERAYLPNLNFNARNRFTEGLFFDPLSNQAEDGFLYSNNLSLSSQVPVYQGNKLKNTKAQSKINLHVSKLNLQKSKNDLSLNIAVAYLQILFNRENLGVSQRNLSNTREQIERTKKMVKSGVLPKTNLYDLEAQAASDELQVVTNKNSLNFSILQLKQLLQLPEETSFDVVLPIIPEPDLNVLVPNSQIVYQEAQGILPEIKSADLQIASADRGVAIAHSNYMPSVSLSAGVTTNYSSFQARDGVTSGRGLLSQWSDAFNWAVNLSISVPIYNRYQFKAAAQKAKIFKHGSVLNAQIVRNTVRQTIEQAQLDVLAAAKSFLASKKRVHALEESFRVTEYQYRKGAANVTEFNVTKNNLTNARSDLIRAKYDHIFKLKALEFYMGKDIKL